MRKLCKRHSDNKACRINLNSKCSHMTAKGRHCWEGNGVFFKSCSRADRLWCATINVLYWNHSPVSFSMRFSLYSLILIGYFPKYTLYCEIFQNFGDFQLFLMSQSSPRQTREPCSGSQGHLCDKAGPYHEFPAFPSPDMAWGYPNFSDVPWQLFLGAPPWTPKAPACGFSSLLPSGWWSHSFIQTLYGVPHCVTLSGTC